MSGRSLACGLVAFAALALAGTACSSDGAGIAALTSGASTTTASTVVETTAGSATSTSTSAPAAVTPTTRPRPRPTTTVGATPRLSDVRVATPPGATCVLGTSTTTVLLWSSSAAAGVRIYSTAYGDLGQFPAEAGSAEVPFECDGGSTIFSLTPIAEGGAAGERVDLEVPSYMT